MDMQELQLYEPNPKKLPWEEVPASMVQTLHDTIENALAQDLSDSYPNEPQPTTTTTRGGVNPLGQVVLDYGDEEEDRGGDEDYKSCSGDGGSVDG